MKNLRFFFQRKAELYRERSVPYLLILLPQKPETFPKSLNHSRVEVSLQNI
jgi:hypothetical protein